MPIAIAISVAYIALDHTQSFAKVTRSVFRGVGLAVQLGTGYSW